MKCPSPAPGRRFRRRSGERGSGCARTDRTEPSVLPHTGKRCYPPKQKSPPHQKQIRFSVKGCTRLPYPHRIGTSPVLRSEMAFFQGRSSDFRIDWRPAPSHRTSGSGVVQAHPRLQRRDRSRFSRDSLLSHEGTLKVQLLFQKSSGVKRKHQAKDFSSY